MHNALTHPYTMHHQSVVVDLIHYTHYTHTLHKLYASSYQSVVVDLFQGQLRSMIHCPVCGHKSVTFDPFMFLSMPIPIVNDKVLGY
jgi:ubiquitin C-terminal hydrolase